MVNPGQGVDIYIIDSGIATGYVDEQTGERWALPEFTSNSGSRVIDEINYSDSDTWDDDAGLGHGTQVAGAAGGNTFGIAKGATLRNVKCERRGLTDPPTLVRCLDEIVRRHNERRNMVGFKGSIINMSFGGERWDNLEQALTSAFDAGISLVACKSTCCIETEAMSRH